MDEVSGGRPSQCDTQPKQNGHRNCDECAVSGKVVTASGFCDSCSDFLCPSCIDHHKIQLSTRSHEIIKGKVMTTIQPDKLNVDQCTMHPGRPIEAYCPNDDTFGCALCFTVGHRSCQNVALLSDLSRGVETSKEFLDVQNAADRYKKLMEEFIQVISKYLSKNDDWHSKTLERFEKFRSEVLSIVEEIGIKVHEEADALKKENTSQLNKLAYKIATYSKEVKQYMVNIDDRKDRNENEQLYVDLKKNGGRVIDTVHRLETIYKDIAVKKFEFQFDLSIKKRLIKTNTIHVETTSLPSLHRTELEKEKNANVLTGLASATTYKSTSWVNMKSRNDIHLSWITGIIELSETKLVLADHNNICLKLFDVASNTIIQRRSLIAKPWDITKLPGCRVAVSFPYAKQLQVFKTDMTLDPCGYIHVPFGCRGLHCTGDRLIETNASPSKVLVLNMICTVLQIIQINPSRDKFFYYPLYLTVSNDKKRIYVSDYNNHALTCVTATGVIKWVYRDQKLKYPLGVTTGDNGCIFICSMDTHTIHVVSCDGSKLAIIQTRQFGIQYPYAVHYTGNKGTLYVTTCSDDHNMRLCLQ